MFGTSYPKSSFPARAPRPWTCARLARLCAFVAIAWFAHAAFAEAFQGKADSSAPPSQVTKLDEELQQFASLPVKEALTVYWRTQGAIRDQEGEVEKLRLQAHGEFVAR